MNNAKKSITKLINEKFVVQFSLSGIILAVNVILFILLITQLILLEQKSSIMSQAMDSAIDLMINTPPAEPICNCICNYTLIK